MAEITWRLVKGEEHRSLMMREALAERTTRRFQPNRRPYQGMTRPDPDVVLRDYGKRFDGSDWRVFRKPVTPLREGVREL